MRDYTVEQSSLNLKWAYARMVPFVPTPGTPSFAALCKGLSPYNLEPARITVDAPSSRFGDVTLGIGLLNNRVALRLTPGFLELHVSDLYDGDEEKLLSIVDLAFAVVNEVDPDSSQGEAHVRLASHLKLAPLENFAVLHEHLRMSDSISEFIPEAAAYQIDSTKASNTKELRVVIAKSLAFEDALFVDVNAVYAGPIETAALAKQVESDFELVAARLGLKEKVDSV